MENHTIKAHPCQAIPPKFDRIDLEFERLVPILSSEEKDEIETDLMIKYNASCSVTGSLDEYLLNAQIQFQEERIVTIERQANMKKREVRQQCEEMRDKLIQDLSREIFDEPLNIKGLNDRMIIQLQTEAKTECEEWLEAQVRKIEAKAQAEIAKYHEEIDDWERLEVDICSREIASCQAKIQEIRREPELFPSTSRVKAQSANYSNNQASTQSNSSNNGYGTNGNSSNGNHSNNGSSHSPNGNTSNGNGVKGSASFSPNTDPTNPVGNETPQSANPSTRQNRKGVDSWREEKRLAKEKGQDDERQAA